jgi:tetratricopeptide (TPR) repeat protein
VKPRYFIFFITLGLLTLSPAFSDFTATKGRLTFMPWLSTAFIDDHSLATILKMLKDSRETHPKSDQVFIDQLIKFFSDPKLNQNSFSQNLMALGTIEQEFSEKNQKDFQVQYTVALALENLALASETRGLSEDNNNFKKQNLELCEKLAKNFPKEPKAHFMLGTTLAGNPKHHLRALSSLQKCIRLNPKSQNCSNLIKATQAAYELPYCEKRDLNQTIEFYSAAEIPDDDHQRKETWDGKTVYLGIEPALTSYDIDRITFQKPDEITLRFSETGFQKYRRFTWLNRGEQGLVALNGKTVAIPKIKGMTSTGSEMTLMQTPSNGFCRKVTKNTVPPHLKQ